MGFIAGITNVMSVYRLLTCLSVLTKTLKRRHNDRDGISNHKPHGCLLNRLFGCRLKKTLVNSPHKGPATRKMLPFDDVIMKTKIIIGPKEPFDVLS